MASAKTQSTKTTRVYWWLWLWLRLWLMLQMVLLLLCCRCRCCRCCCCSSCYCYSCVDPVLVVAFIAVVFFSFRWGVSVSTLLPAVVALCHIHSTHVKPTQAELRKLALSRPHGSSMFRLCYPPSHPTIEHVWQTSTVWGLRARPKSGHWKIIAAEGPDALVDRWDGNPIFLERFVVCATLEIIQDLAPRDGCYQSSYHPTCGANNTRSS